MVKRQKGDYLVLMASNSSSKALRIIIVGYCLLYFAGFIFPIITGNSSNELSKVELYTVPLAFLVFLTGTIYSFINEKISGIIILLWHFVVWVFSLLLWPDAGMVLVLIFPVIIPAIFMIRNWYSENNAAYKAQWWTRWRLTLRIFMVNYAVIYLLVVFSNVVPKLLGWNLVSPVDDLAVWSYTSFLGISLIFLLALFFFGFVVSWKSELIAGIVFIVWYISILMLAMNFPEFANSGPSGIFGITILVQGILYIFFYFKLRQKPTREGI